MGASYGDNGNWGDVQEGLFASALPEVQAGNLNQCKTTKYVSYQRARRKDAEPITRRYKMRLSALYFFDNLCDC